MNKAQKIQLLQAISAGNKSEVDRLLKADKQHFFFEIQPGKYCTNQNHCNCVDMAECTHLQDAGQLKADYPRGVFFEISEIVEFKKSFGFEPLEPQNMVQLRANELNFRDKFLNE